VGKQYPQVNGESKRRESVFCSVATLYSVIEIVSRLEKVGFKRFNFAQTVYGYWTERSDIERTKSGCGEGSFVVVRAGR